MTESLDLSAGQWVRVAGREELGSGEIFRVRTVGERREADVAFDEAASRRLLSFPLDRLTPVADLWHRLPHGPTTRHGTFCSNSSQSSFRCTTAAANSPTAGQTFSPTRSY